jgi:hypothetical protein
MLHATCYMLHATCYMLHATSYTRITRICVLHCIYLPCISFAVHTGPIVRGHASVDNNKTYNIILLLLSFVHPTVSINKRQANNDPMILLIERYEAVCLYPICYIRLATSSRISSHRPIATHVKTFLYFRAFHFLESTDLRF